MLFLHPKKNKSASNPPERATQNNIPRQLLREEILHPRSPNKLGQRPRQPKRVRQPRRITPPAKARLKVPLSVQELPDQCLSGGHVRVVLDPRAADEVELAFHHFLFDAVEEGWV